LQGTALSLDIKAILANLPLFRELSPGEIDRIASHAREVRAGKGELIFQKGDPSHGFYVVVHGQVKLAFPSPQGGEKVVEIIGARQSFGEAVMFLEKPYPVFAQALVDTLLLHIERAMVFEELAQDPAFARKMLAGLSIRLHGLIKDVESYSMRSCTQRVIGYLLQQGPENAAGEVVLSLPTSKNVIASRLNITPETFSRILHDLSDAGLISVKGKDICIPDLEKLRAHDQ
jgi:CRP-like cAMP-binding protein